MNNLKEIDIREIDGFLIGNAENEKTATGCTAILCPKPARLQASMSEAEALQREKQIFSIL